jgi:YVTN family beta-propeller protein
MPAIRTLTTAVLVLLGLAGTGTADTLLIADKTDHTLIYFDTRTGRVTRSVRVGENPHEVAVTRDGRLALVANPGSNSVSIVDIATGVERKRLHSDLFGFPHGMAVHPDGRTIYLTSEQKRLLIALDVRTLEIAKSLSTEMDGSHMVVLSPDGGRAYITDRGSARVTVVDTAAWTILAQIPAGDGVEGIALSPDGRILVVGNRNDNNVHFIDTAALKPAGSIAVGRGPVRVACSPDGRLALVSHRAGGDVHVIDLATRTVTARVAVGAEPGGMAFSMDGTRAFVANTGAGSISAIDLATMKVLHTWPAGKGPDGITMIKTPAPPSNEP